MVLSSSHILLGTRGAVIGDAREFSSVHLSDSRIFLFSTPCGVGSPLCMRNMNCKHQMDQNLVGSILGRSSIKIAHLVPIR